jgi:hypothetical protein
MSEPVYHHGGFSFADLVHELYRLYRDIREVQSEIDRRITAREIVLTKELPKGWYLDCLERSRKARGGREPAVLASMVATSGKPHDLREWRYHVPPPPPPPELPSFEEEEPPPEEQPPAPENDSPAPSLPLGWPAGYAGHQLSSLLERWYGDSPVEQGTTAIKQDAVAVAQDAPPIAQDATAVEQGLRAVERALTTEPEAGAVEQEAVPIEEDPTAVDLPQRGAWQRALDTLLSMGGAPTRLRA